MAIDVKLTTKQAERLASLWRYELRFSSRLRFATKMAEVIITEQGGDPKNLTDSQRKAAYKRLERLEKGEIKLTAYTLNILAATKGISPEEIETRIFEPAEEPGILHGRWKQIIPKQRSHSAAEDLVKCEHFGNHIEGKIEGVSPNERKGQRWAFRGEVFDRYAFCIFWPAEGSRSYGMCNLIRIEEKLWEGHYVRPNIRPKKGGGVILGIQKVILKWQPLAKAS
jgi:hypothetical protein